MSDEDYQIVDGLEAALKHLSNAALSQKNDDGYQEVLSVLSEVDTSLFELSQKPKRRAMLEGLARYSARGEGSSEFVQDFVKTQWFEACLTAMDTSLAEMSTAGMDCEVLVGDMPIRLASVIASVCRSSFYRTYQHSTRTTSMRFINNKRGS